MHMLIFAILLGGCVADEPGDAQGARASAQQAGQQQKAKAAKNQQQQQRSKTAKGQQNAPPTARRGAQGGKAGKASEGAKPKPKPIGVDGPITGVLQLSLDEAEDGTSKTRAELVMSWEGGEKTVLLGKTPGTCEAAEPRPLDDHTPLWWSVCTNEDQVADFAIGQQDALLTVRRALRGPDDTSGEFKIVRRVPLAEGAELVVGTATP